MFDENELIKSLFGKYPVNKIIISGPLPPPIGGVSVFCDRLINLLSRKRIDLRFLRYPHNLYQKIINALKLVYFILFRRYRVILFNSYVGGLSRFLIKCLKSALRLEIILIVHNNHNLRWVRKDISAVSLSRLVLVGDAILKEMEKQGFNLPLQPVIQNAFIPPYKSEENLIRSLSADITDFIENHSPLIIANASRILFRDGIDLYGIDLCLMLMKRLTAKFPSAGLIFALAEINDRDYYEKIKKSAGESNIENNLFFLINKDEYWPLLKKADIFIRPTYKDGYGISIDEALYFNCPAIASNCCKRHRDAVLFENRNIDDLENKVLEVLNEKNE